MASVLQHPFRSLILQCLIVIISLAAVPRIASADDLTTVMPDGSTKAFPGVVVEKLQKDGSGKDWLLVRFGEGASHPVELSRVQSIVFGDAGAGRQYNVTVGDTSRQEAFTGATFFRFQGGNFEAKPPEETTHYGLPPGRILTMELSQPLPAAAGGATAAPTPAAEDDLFANAAAGGTPDPFAAAGSGDSGAAAPDGSGPTPSAQYGNDIEGELNALMAKAMGVLVGACALLLISFTTWLWLVIYSFQKGNTAEGIILIVLCWCFLAKLYYMRNYEGSNKGLLTGLIYTELIGGIILKIIMRTLE